MLNYAGNAYEYDQHVNQIQQTALMSKRLFRYLGVLCASGIQIT